MEKQVKLIKNNNNKKNPFLLQVFLSSCRLIKTGINVSTAMRPASTRLHVYMLYIDRYAYINEYICCFLISLDHDITHTLNRNVQLSVGAVPFD